MSRMLRCPDNLEALHELASRPTPGVIDTLRRMEGDALVLGAGGKMGYHLTRMVQRGLREAGSRQQVHAVSRFQSDAATTPFAANGIPTIKLDLTDVRQLDRLPPFQNVFFMAGVKFGASDQPGLLQTMNIDMPARVAEYCRRAGARVVGLSTGCVYSFSRPESGGSSESDSLDPPGAYAISCLGREQAFADALVPCSLIRLNYSVDLRYGVLVDLAQQVLAGQPVDVTTGWVNVIWQGDANAYIIQSLGQVAIPPSVINVTGPHVLKVRDIATRFGERFGMPVTFCGQESETAWLSNASAAHTRWGMPQVSENELIDWVADWLLQGGVTLGKPTQFQVRDGKY